MIHSGQVDVSSKDQRSSEHVCTEKVKKNKINPRWMKKKGKLVEFTLTCCALEDEESILRRRDEQIKSDVESANNRHSDSS